MQKQKSETVEKTDNGFERFANTFILKLKFPVKLFIIYLL